MVVGEGEYVFPNMLKYFNGTNKELPPKGLMYKNEGKIGADWQAWLGEK